MHAKWLLVLTAVLLMLARAAMASLLAYEGFDYPAGTQEQNLNGGFGFSSPWLGRALSIASPGLTDSTGTLSVSGNCATTYSTPIGPYRGLGIGAPRPTDGTTLYLSFVATRPLQSIGSNDPSVGIILEGGMDPRGDALSWVTFGLVQDQQNVWGMSVTLPPPPQSYGVTLPVSDEPVLMVLRIDFKPGPERFTVFVNPTPGLPEPAGISMEHAFDFWYGMYLFLYPGARVDEIRIGETFADVTPVPEACSTTVFVFASAALLRRRFRR